MTTTEPRAIPPAQRTLPAMLQRQAARFGQRPLLQVAGRAWSHADAASAAAGRAAALAQAGLARGDRVALMSGNRIEFLEVFLGAGWLGAVAVPINTASMGPQIEYFLANSQARLLVIEAELLPRLHTADLRRTVLEEIWVIGEPATDWRPAEGVRLVRFPSAGQAIEPAAVGPGDPLAILYTSGTTGPAKGVVCPHAQYFWWSVNSAEVLGVGPDDVLCSTLPLFHINALNTFGQAALTGAEVVFESRFSASGFWPSMRACKATVVYLLGAMVPILLAQPEGPGERDHRVRTGLGPGVPSAAGQAFMARTGVRLLEGYGSTETNFAIATAPDSPRGGVMGWLRPGFQARVADALDAELPPGEAGELLLRADEPFAFASGYFDMPEKTVEAWRNLWFHTGDRVLRESDGAFRFVDRIKDAIRRRGENISSFEVEQVLLSHPAVAACAVYPVGSDLAEDEVMAALVAREGQALVPDELMAFCESRLPYFAVPRYVDLLDDLPRTENGKVQKYKLRERGVSATTWDRGPAGRARA
ncbi:ATP-dependent acyl-CoA ligase [Variovorax sp. J22P168]|uniref:ATP-dependent acyl-CoA ligase n=1 Tax=Variovorax jilinensis TaxID=3053513 RepID=UPI0025754A66|nr:ATP-dependent acyl-CoA ligase [Variovorax sp. J22P168]MDM0015520.1 ATP-dependent acyl-CoA ligase [Variovorax sp. J22P168]